MYRNALTPSRFFGIILLLFAAAGLLIWLTCLVDTEASAFDIPGLILLRLTLGLLIPSVLFLRRTRWIRIPMSVLLDILALTLLATMLYTVPDAVDTFEIVMIVAFTLLGVGLLFVGILALHNEAMVTALAVHLYQAQEGRLPESLRQLVDAGLLPKVPMDPYSGAPLIYRVVNDDFTLYSVGEDFVDDGGRHCDWDDISGGDHVFWPVPGATDVEEQI